MFLDGTGRLRTAWRFLIYLMGFVVVQIVVGVIIVVGFILFLAVGDGMAQLQDPDFADKLENEWMIPLQAIASPFIVAGVVLLSVVCRKYLDRRSISSMGLVRLRRPLLTLLGGFLAGVIPIVATALVAMSQGGFRFNGFGFSAMAGIFIPALILMAFMEEIMTRGYLLQNLLDIRWPVFGVLFTSLLFWLMHSLNPNAWSSPFVGINLFGAGVVLSLAYIAARDIWFPTALHFGWNFAQGIVLSIPISGMKIDGFVRLELVESAPSWLTGGAFGLEASALTTVAEILMSGLLLAYIFFSRPKQSEPQLDSPKLTTNGHE